MNTRDSIGEWPAIALTSSKLGISKAKDFTMKVHILDGQAFVEVASGYLLCIGNVKEVKELTPEELYELVQSILLVKKEEEKDGEGN